MKVNMREFRYKIFGPILAKYIINRPNSLVMILKNQKLLLNSRLKCAVKQMKGMLSQTSSPADFCFTLAMAERVQSKMDRSRFGKICNSYDTETDD